MSEKGRREMDEAKGDAGKKAEDRAQQSHESTEEITVTRPEGTVSFTATITYRPDEEKMLEAVQCLLNYKPSHNPLSA